MERVRTIRNISVSLPIVSRVLESLRCSPHADLHSRMVPLMLLKDRVSMFLGVVVGVVASLVALPEAVGVFLRVVHGHRCILHHRKV